MGGPQISASQEVWHLGVFSGDDLLRGEFSHGNPRLGHGCGDLLGHPVVRGLAFAVDRCSLVALRDGGFKPGKTMEKTGKNRWKPLMEEFGRIWYGNFVEKKIGVDTVLLLWGRSDR